MGNGRKKRGLRSGDDILLPANSKDTAGSSHGAASAQQVKPTAHPFSNAEKSNAVDFGAFPYSAYSTTFPVESSFPAMPKRTSSEPCRYFQRGYCWNGDCCRFQHSEGPCTAPPNPMRGPAPPTPTPKAFIKKERAPEECLDWYLTGSCPRYRTCRYAHPSNMRMDEESFGSYGKASGKGLGVFDFMADQLIRQGLCGSSNGGKFGKKVDQRIQNGGFTDDDVYELSLQGIKPWDPEAWDALAVLNGYDMDGGYGYDYDDYSDDEVDERMGRFGFY